jgi:predicted transcriptional regulator of viral defense system
LIGKGYELLDPSLKKRNNLNKKWLLDVNIW